MLLRNNETSELPFALAKAIKSLTACRRDQHGCAAHFYARIRSRILKSLLLAGPDNSKGWDISCHALQRICISQAWPPPCHQANTDRLILLFSGIRLNRAFQYKVDMAS